MIKRLCSTWLAAGLTGLAVSLSAAAQPAAGRTAVLDPNRVVEMALAKNYVIRVARFDPLIAEQEVSGAWGRYDPTFETVWESTRDDNFEAGNPPLPAHSDFFSTGLRGAIPFGTTYGLTVEALEFRTGRNGFSEIGAHRTFAGLTLTQPLLRGFGLRTGMASIRLARTTLEGREEGFRQAVIDTLRDALTAYYDLCFARTFLDVAKRSEGLAARLLSDNRRRAEEGALAPIDVSLAESELAIRSEAVIVAEQASQTAEIRLAGILTDQPRQLLDSRPWQLAPLPIPVEVTADPARDGPQALQHRPDVRQARLDVQGRQIELSRDRNAARPDLSVTGRYGYRGLDDTRRSSFDRLEDRRMDAYSVEAVFSYPLPNRERGAQKAAAYLRRNRAQLGLRQAEQTALLAVEEAAVLLQTSWRRIAAASRATELARLSLRAEEKKLQAGTSTTFVVLRLQQDLAQAEVREIGAITDYQKAIVGYDRELGLILARHGVSLDNAAAIGEDARLP